MLSHDLLCGWAQNPWKENVRFPYLFYEDWSNDHHDCESKGRKLPFAAHSQVTESWRGAVLGHIFSDLFLYRSSKLGFEVLIHRGLIDSFCLIFLGLALGVPHAGCLSSMGLIFLFEFGSDSLLCPLLKMESILFMRQAILWWCLLLISLCCL